MDAIEAALIISTTIIWMYAYYVILLSFSIYQFEAF
jgi:hypothetical protein